MGVRVPAGVRDQHHEYFQYLTSVQRMDELDLDRYDVVVASQPPTYLAAHDHVVAVFYHQARVFYDLSDTVVQSGVVHPEVHEHAVREIRRLDRSRVGRVHTWLAGSDEVAGRLARYWGIVDNVRPDMDLAREETFGPVLSIIPVDDVEEALRVANDSDYGLAGSVFGRDKATVRRVVEQFSTGAISVNDALVTALLPSLPFGGVRSSGFGRLHGDAGIREFAVPKAVATDRFPWLPGLTGSMFGSIRPSAAQVATVLRLVWGRTPR